MTSKEARERYGPIVDGVWRDEANWCVFLDIPNDIAADWINTATGKPLGSKNDKRDLYINKDMAPALLMALDLLKTRGLFGELKTYDGCLMVRDVRGVPGQLSTHAYALAIDLNASENRLGRDPKLSKDFVACFKEAGFTWGGDFWRKDGMHFSFAWEG